MPPKFGLDRQVVIVTGAGNGLGRAHALAFAKAGARVVVNDLGGSQTGEGKGTKAADQVVDEIKTAGGEAVANYDSVIDGEKIVQCAMDSFGRLDTVVNNAGILRDKSFQKMTRQDWDLVYDVHVRGAFRVTHAAWPHMREQEYGRIIMTASAAGIYGNFGQANYSMAKLGLAGFANTLAIEGRKRNIHVNTIAPIAGSRMTEGLLPQAMLDALKPELVSPLVLWLCHPDCEETGGLFEVGGGFYAKLRWERSEGEMFRLGREISPQDVRDVFDGITSFEKSTHPTDVMTSMRPIGANIEAGPSKGANEFIDVDRALGFEYPEITTSYDERDTALYALSVGAATNPTDKAELPLVYERSSDGFKTLPSFAVIPALKVMFDFATEGVSAPGFNFGLERVLHGEQKTTVRRPFPPKATLTHRSRIKDIFDKGKGAIVITEVRTFDEDGDELAVNELTTFVRGAGGFGGERGPSVSFPPPERKPDAVEEQKIPENQALLYRLTGDWNPLHADPNFAKAMGFERPILHGLCTYGYATRHAIKHFLGGDPRKFKSIRARFSESVFPGETLITEMWKEGDAIILQCKVKERDVVVLSNARVELYDAIPEKKVTKKVAEKKAAPESAAKGADSMPGSLLVFLGIRAHVETHPELKEIGKVFVFQISSPESSWTIDTKEGAVHEGVVGKSDCTLKLTEADFMRMSSGKANPQKLFMDGALTIDGDVMASQKLSFLQAIKPDAVRARVGELLEERKKNGPAVAQDKAPERTPFADTARAALGAQLKDQTSLKGTALLRVQDPETQIRLDLANSSLSEGGDEADCQITLSDVDLEALFTGSATFASLHQRGLIRVDGSMAVARQLSFLQGLSSKQAGKKE